MPFPYLKAYRIPKELRNNPYALFKYAFKEQTPVVISGILFFIGASYFIYKAKQYTDIGQDTKRYKLAYTVYRDDDPRVKNIKQ